MSTILTSTHDRQVLATTPTELGQAQQVVDELETKAGGQLSLNPGAERDFIMVPNELSSVVARVLSIVAAGGTVTIGSMPEELSTSTAAEQLGVSRPTLMKMIERQEIKAHKVGTHSRLRSSDVMEFRKARQARRRQAFEELRELEDPDNIG